MKLAAFLARLPWRMKWKIRENKYGAVTLGVTALNVVDGLLGLRKQLQKEI